MSVAISKTPTIGIASDIVSALSTTSKVLMRRTGIPLTFADFSSKLI